MATGVLKCVQGTAFHFIYVVQIGMTNDSRIAQTATEARRCLFFAPFKITAATRLETGTVKLLLPKSLDSQYPRGNEKRDENLEPLPSFCTRLIHFGS